MQRISAGWYVLQHLCFSPIRAGAVLWSIFEACILVSSSSSPFHQILVFRLQYTAVALSYCKTISPQPTKFSHLPCSWLLFFPPLWQLFWKHCCPFLWHHDHHKHKYKYKRYIYIHIKEILLLRSFFLYFLPDSFKSPHWFHLPPHQTHAFSPLSLNPCHVISFRAMSYHHSITRSIPDTQISVPPTSPFACFLPLDPL